ncbi:MAG: hypothetical protein IT161_14475 [Bryobacterales bacterium]|nr:hypothetical protein [Bryobacterales bacterium]
MYTSLDAKTTLYLNSLKNVNAGIERAQREIGTGKRVISSSDDPDVLSGLMQTRSDLARLKQVQANMNRLDTEVNTAESTLQQAVKLFDRVRVLASEASGIAQTADSRRTIAGEVQDLLERFVKLANTESDGRMIFSGDSDQSGAYSIDFTQTPPWSAYQGTAATRRALHPNGTTFAIAKPADEIFDNADAASNVYASVEALRQALLTNDETALRSAMDGMAGVSTHLNNMLGFYGNAQSQISDAKDTASKMQLNLSTQLAGFEDADVTESVVTLQQLQFQQQAALQVRASTPMRSLFDYLG